MLGGDLGAGGKIGFDCLGFFCLGGFVDEGSRATSLRRILYLR